ncbi:CheR family methyltransferase [uncultured Microscilla sp.]|uniref:CheR family methyltransferase n=1 Tax=uncultured Microscilla sp. TaxID=432653 RepID=UPI0026094764|nr:CheR family methyltransferase [uncultured Microscilla sp.]
MKGQAGYDLSGIKNSYIETQVKAFQQKVGANDLNALFNYLKSNPAALTQLTNACLNNATRYFRNPRLFELLRQLYLPALLKQSSVNIWVAACSLGDEAFSLAITIHELLQQTLEPCPAKVHIWATDISAKAIDTAKAGYAIESNLVSVGEAIKQKYFHYKDHRYYVQPAIKNYVEFAVHDLLQPLANAPKFDLIICRNALLYYDIAYQQHLITNLHQHLKPQGIFIISEFESMPANCASLFTKSAEAPYIFTSNL